MSPVTATFQHGRRTQYRLQGGAWDGPDLDTLVRDAPRPRIGAPHDALVDGDIRLTATDIDDLTSALAGGLRDLGVRRRDAVAWQLTTGYEAVLLFRACWRLGAVAVPIAPAADEATVTAVLDALHPRVLVGAKHLTLGRHADAVVVGGASLPSRRGGPPDAPAGAPTTSRSGAPFARLLAAEPVLDAAAQAPDVAVVFPTGPDGGPESARFRGVIHTHRTLAAKVRTMPERDGLNSADTVLVPAPLTSATGLLQAVVVPLVLGMTTILLPEWNPAIALDVIERERVSFLAATPAAVRMLLREPTFSPRRVRSVRLVSLGGDTVSSAFADRAAGRFGARVTRTYGFTEAPMVTASSPADPTDEARHTDGRAIGDTELRIVDPATAQDRDPGDEGELWIRGPELCAGYLPPGDNQDAFARGGWFRSGDLGAVRPDGTVTVNGRIDAGICIGARATGAGPLEAWLQDHPQLDEAVVVAAGGSRVTAFVTQAGTSTEPARSVAALVRDEAAEWLATDDSAPPVELDAIRVVRSLPLRPSGRVDRVALRRTLEPT